ncbi:adenosylmethionine--8-amino-7-oxononanoate transaminase [Deinococcus cellulosilyticus]|uniref:Adenosylmethionine-8-amino-7-oxononanoate aminotransferase n=1 Tax=Deinococcus cellulosilyticus (strain DSM 18568 / NBRC 106333 / KACC 11606 / 5516J-15) TaxID=1223518 RepID=A0A511N0T2_DEIC1|nr:adenosylmethionine--8-amino-7-oxononanoate transaminase [Deinococcus cellulosilyticus]GEM46058.1 adenosylmethionine--8-amino-7-oxononanoate aminotransferase BioA [Deinococcus cellulosilyticus NBRC 106333 = KACC 11606]
MASEFIWPPFTQTRTAPESIRIMRGEGAVLYPEEGPPLLDLISSWWVNLHGHAHPHIAQAIAEQARTLEHVIFAGFSHAPAEKLAERLCSLTGLDRMFFSDNGSTSVEVALKMALQFFQNAGVPRKRLLALEGGYHGDTFGAMAVGHSSGFYGPFQHLLFEVDVMPFPHDPDHTLQWLQTYLQEHGDHLAAVILEPLVQGASGMRMYPPTFLEVVCDQVHQAGCLVILDEVMTGFYRTGTLFAFQHTEILPDFLCLSKGITGGFMPMGATLTIEQVFRQFEGESFQMAFAHGHSYTANPLSCAAALASLDLLTSAETLVNIRRIEQQHHGFLQTLQQRPGMMNPRVQGTILAFEWQGSGAYGSQSSLNLRQAFLEEGLLLRPLGNTIYLLPPYCITPEQLERAYQSILETLTT